MAKNKSLNGVVVAAAATGSAKVTAVASSSCAVGKLKAKSKSKSMEQQTVTEAKSNANTYKASSASSCSEAVKVVQLQLKKKLSLSLPTDALSSSLPPAIIERTQMDDVLKDRMRWSTSTGSLTVLKAVAKFKVLAGRATAFIDAQQEEGDIDLPSTPRDKRRNKINKIKEGQTLLTQRLDFLNLKSVAMMADGNCQFRSFSSELFGTQDNHAYVRQIAVQFMKAHVGDFSVYVGKITVADMIHLRYVIYYCSEDNQSWDKYISGMSRLKSWGDELTLRALCEALSVTVHVITTDKENWHMLYEPQSGKVVRHVFLSYISPVHYNTVTIK